MQAPKVLSQIPWLEHKPSSGQLNLEQSKPWRPLSHEHSPVEKSQIPASLQSEGQIHSEQSKPVVSELQSHFPVDKLQIPLPLHGVSPPGHEMSMQMLPSKPVSQIQIPVDPSQFPWFEHKPSPGHFILEQSKPSKPALHEHSPVEVSQVPELLQFPGQIHSVQSNPVRPALQAHSPVIILHVPFPLQGKVSPGHVISVHKISFINC